MRKALSCIIISLITVLSYSQLKTGYEINLTINGLRDSTIFLAYHLGDKQYINDTVKLDKTGSAIIRGTTVLPQGSI